MAPPTVSELSETELAVWRGFLRLHAALAKQLDAELEAAHGLPLSSYEVLINLQAAPDQRLRMADLADRALLSRSGMTRLVDRLERQGLLARARPTHLAGVREKFLQHLEPGDFERLAALWEAMMPGVTAPTQKT